MTQAFVIVPQGSPPPAGSKAAQLQDQLRALTELSDFALGQRVGPPDSPFLREQLGEDFQATPPIGLKRWAAVFARTLSGFHELISDIQTQWSSLTESDYRKIEESINSTISGLKLWRQ